MRQSSDYMDFILDKFSSLQVVSAKKMFGGYVIHMAGKVLGFVFEDTFFFEPGPTVDRMLPKAPRQELFPGSKLFVIIDEAMSSQRLCELAQACYDDFPIPKPRKRKASAEGGQGLESQNRKEIESQRRKEAESQRRKEIEKEFPFAKNIKW